MTLYNGNVKDNSTSENSGAKIHIIAGLKNFGSTCKMNAVLQCLTNCSPLRDFLLNVNLHNGCHDGTKFCMTCALRRYVKTVINNCGEILLPTKIIKI